MTVVTESWSMMDTVMSIDQRIETVMNVTQRKLIKLDHRVDKALKLAIEENGSITRELASDIVELGEADKTKVMNISDRIIRNLRFEITLITTPDISCN